VRYGGQSWLRRGPVDFFSALSLRDGDVQEGYPLGVSYVTIHRSSHVSKAIGVITFGRTWAALERCREGAAGGDARQRTA
jgi:hypothetical protein